MPITGKNKEEISLYFHIPFCSKKCPYCHFYVIPDKPSHKKIFLESLFKEWQLRISHLKDKKIISIYFGGGTPSLFPEGIENILSWIRIETEISPKIEVTIEANPEDINLALAKRFYEMGINRLSMGVQSLSDPMLQTLGRSHDASKALLALNAIKDSGITNVSIDLMYDLPNQTFTTWQETLTSLPSLPITHLSLYNLTLEPHTVFFKKRKELGSLLPTPETSLRMLQEAIKVLEEAGLKRYEISAFAKEGCESKHNTGYWTARPFLGYGPSAFSYWEKKRFRNSANLLRYAKALDEGKDPVDFAELLSLEDQQKEIFAVEIRLLRGVNITQFEQKTGSLSPSLRKSLSKLQQEEWLFQKDNTILLTEKGLLFYDTVGELII